jgi:hypothetical protein
MPSKLRTPFDHAEKAEYGLKKEGVYGRNRHPSVSKPAEYGSGDIPLKFEDKSPSLRETPGSGAPVRSPMDQANKIAKR